MTANHTNPKPFIVPVFIPHRGCPHRCVFCNQRTVTGCRDSDEDTDQIRAYISEFLGYKRADRGRVQISFYGGTFLGLEPERIHGLLALGQEFVDGHGVHGLRFSTRPDTVTPDRLGTIAPFSVQTVELGVQSMDNRVLELSGRGHGTGDTVRAMEMLKQKGYETGVQMMVGLPGDTADSAIKTAELLADLKPDFVRIYPTVVLKNSGLERLYKKDAYRPLELGESVTLVKQLFEVFASRDIPVIRMGLQHTDGLDSEGRILAGPYHPSFGHLVHSERFLDKTRTLLRQMNLDNTTFVALAVHPKRISVARGLKNSNIQVLKTEFGLGEIRIHADDTLDTDSIKVINT